MLGAKTETLTYFAPEGGRSFAGGGLERRRNAARRSGSYGQGGNNDQAIFRANECAQSLLEGSLRSPARHGEEGLAGDELAAETRGGGGDSTTVYKDKTIR